MIQVVRLLAAFIEEMKLAASSSPCLVNQSDVSNRSCIDQSEASTSCIDQSEASTSCIDQSEASVLPGAEILDVASAHVWPWVALAVKPVIIIIIE